MWESHFVIFETFTLLVPRGYYHILVKQMSAEQRDNDFHCIGHFFIRSYIPQLH